MFLSIIIPVYNCGKFLEECLNSVFTQDIPQSDYEVICINDGSKDNSQSILEKFAAVHKNLHLISQENKGAAAARNEGLKKAVGDYIWFVDADDLICENILSLLKSKIEACNCDRMSFGFYYFDGNLTEEQRKGINISENGNGGFDVIGEYWFKPKENQTIYYEDGTPIRQTLSNTREVLDKFDKKYENQIRYRDTYDWIQLKPGYGWDQWERPGSVYGKQMGK